MNVVAYCASCYEQAMANGGCVEKSEPRPLFRKYIDPAHVEHGGERLHLSMWDRKSEYYREGDIEVVVIRASDWEELTRKDK